MTEFTYGFELSYPLFLLLLPLPVLVFYLAPSYSTKQQAVRVPFFDLLVRLLDQQPKEGAATLQRSAWQKIVLILSWVLLVIAMTKPVVMGIPQTREQIGRDVMVVVDLSGSMAEQDFTNKAGQRVSRLEAAKQVLEDFASNRQGDRLGLILFGDAAFVQTPFTADHSVWLSLLNQTQVGMAGPSTHLGDAIGLAIKTFAQEEELSPQRDLDPNRERVAIVLTDGNDTDSLVPPIDAAKVAKAKGVRIHMIAMGDPRTVGEQALDMDIIENVASTSGGEAFEALDQSSLDRAYQTIGELEPQRYESSTYRPKMSVHHYLVMIVLILNLIALGIVSIMRSASRGPQHV